MSDLAGSTWPREIFAAEIKHDEHEVSGTYVLSEHGTLPRWEGDGERDRHWQCYVDKDIYDSAEKYWGERHEQQAERNAELEAENARLREALTLVTTAKGLTDPTEDGYFAIQKARAILAERYNAREINAVNTRLKEVLVGLADAAQSVCQNRQAGWSHLWACINMARAALTEGQGDE